MDYLVLPLLIFAIFYFVLLRPQSRERKAREAQMAALKKHDRVITNAGIYGTVVSLEDDAVVLKVDENVRIKFSRAAIWQVLGDKDKLAVPDKSGGEKKKSSAEPAS